MVGYYQYQPLERWEIVYKPWKPMDFFQFVITIHVSAPLLNINALINKCVKKLSKFWINYIKMFGPKSNKMGNFQLGNFFYYNLAMEPFQAWVTIVIFIHYKPRIAVPILDL